ncbi:MAG: penicillin-binding protein 1C [Reyranellaceae bacterium]
MRRLLLVSTLCCAALLAAGAVLDRLFPPDLSRFEDRSTLVLDADGKVLRAFTSRDERWRLLATPQDVDPLFLKLLLAYEDRRFRWHPGVDPLSAVRAAGQYVAHGEIVSGASTLTMQTARLLEPHSRDLAGKLFEMARALQLELRYSKQEILTLYLTLAPYGGNLEGVRAAALAYLGKEPRRLTPAEAALLVALPQSPERRRPDLRPDLARRERNWVIEVLAGRGALSAAQRADAVDQPVPAERRALPFLAPHLALALAGEAPPGATVRTHVLGGLQRGLERLAFETSRNFADGADLAMVAVDNRERKVVAYVGSADFFGKAGQNDLARAKRSPGSALKPFAYALAFDDGILHPETLIDDSPYRFGDYAPRNFDRDFQGMLTARSALQQSLNIPAVAVVNRIGPERFAAGLQQAGAALLYPKDASGAGSLAIVLGGAGISLLDLTMLYAGLADGGAMLPLSLRQGDRAAAEKPRRFVGARAAWYVGDILLGSAPPDSYAPTATPGSRRHIAFKTGTSFGFRDAWAVGYSPRYTVGVWVGHADGTPRPGQFGRNAAAPVMLRAFDLLPPEDLTPPRRPADALTVAGTAALPPYLQMFDPSERPIAIGPRHRLHTAAPRILYPVDGALVELHRGAAGDLPLKAEGGQGPLRWVVNGEPLAGQAAWRPDGDGFARIAVVDALGRSSAVQVRVQLAD